MLRPFVYKRASFSHEQELRALKQDLPVADGRLAVERGNTEQGKQVPVDLNTLVEAVSVGPGAPAWYTDLVRKVIVRYGYS